jgi:hypothetical protein
VENLRRECRWRQLQCISFNNSDDFDPVVMRDGRVVWTRWEHHGTQNRFPLFFTRPDGQGTFLFFGTHEGGFHRNFFHPRELPDGKVIAVLSDGVLDDHGPLVILNSDRTTGDPPKNDDYVNITPNVPVGTDGRSSIPFPLPDGRIVASFPPTRECQLRFVHHQPRRLEIERAATIRKRKSWTRWWRRRGPSRR